MKFLIFTATALKCANKDIVPTVAEPSDDLAIDALVGKNSHAAGSDRNTVSSEASAAAYDCAARMCWAVS